MLGPYRDPIPTCVELLPVMCVPEGAPASCCPALARWPAAGAPHRAPAPAYLRALTVAATLLLLVGSASISAVTWTVTSTLFSARSAPVVDEVAHVAPAPAPRAGVPWGPLRAGTSLGTDTHDVDALWSRAEWRAAARAEITLARATVALHALAGEMGAARIVADPRGGLGVVDLEPGSAAALIGLRRGDLVTAVNGFALRRPEDAKRAWAAVAAGRGAVVELLRQGRAVALRIDWVG